MARRDFEWNRAREAGNWRRHGVSFVQAARALCDPFAVEVIDDRHSYGEERVNLIGLCEGALLHVTYTERGDRIRIISVRRTVRHEQDEYYRANSE